MVNRFEDLAPLIAPKGVDRGSVVGFRQGVVESWNQTTGENTIRIGGTLFTDLPITASSSEVLLIQPGDVVAIRVVSGNSAFATMYVDGRVKVPGTPEARDAILSALANNIFSATVDASETTSSPAFTNLDTVGPTVSNVPIGSSGRALVLLTGLISANAGTDDLVGGLMSYEISGATSRSPDDAESLILENGDFALNTLILTRNTAVSFAQDLTPGLHTFTAKYKSATGDVVAFRYRNLTVVAF